MNKKIDFKEGFTVWEAMNSGFSVWTVANEALSVIQHVRDIIEAVNVPGYPSHAYELGIKDLSKVILEIIDGEQ